MKSLLALHLTLALATVVPGQAPPIPAPEAPPGTPAAPTSAGAIERARAAVAAGKANDALRVLQDLAKTDPQSTPPRVALAAILAGSGQGSAARRELELAAREDPKHPEVHLLNAQFALNEGRTTEAILSSQAALQSAVEPRWEADQRARFQRDGRLALAACLERRQDFVAAEANLREILKVEASNGPARVRLGAALFYQGKPTEAFAELAAAAAADPALPQPELQMADLHASKNEAEEASRWRAKAVAARPADYRPQLATASALLDQGKADEAEAFIAAGTKLERGEKELRPVRGLYHRYKREYDKAAAIFGQLHSDSPSNSVYAWNLAICLAETGDKDKQRRAIELAESESRKNSRTTEAFAVLGWCYYKAGQTDAASRALLTGGQLGPLSPDAGYFFAKVYSDQGRYAESLGALKAILASKGAFVYRAEAQALLKDVEPRVPVAPAKP